MNTNKIPCGGFNITDDLTLEDKTLGVNWGGAIKSWAEGDENSPQYIHDRIGYYEYNVGALLDGSYSSWNKSTYSKDAYIHYISNQSNLDRYMWAAYIGTIRKLRIDGVEYENVDPTAQDSYYYFYEVGDYTIRVNGYNSSIVIFKNSKVVKPILEFYQCVTVPHPFPQDLLPNTLIMTSPSKKKFEVSVADDGTLQTKEITT